MRCQNISGRNSFMKKSFSRRAFLQGGTAAAAGGVLLANTVLLHSRAIPSVAQAVAPSDRVRFGMIGIGMQGSGLLSGAIHAAGRRVRGGAADLYDGRHTLANEFTGNASLPDQPPLPGTARPQRISIASSRPCPIIGTGASWWTPATRAKIFTARSRCRTTWPMAGHGRRGAEK